MNGPLVVVGDSLLDVDLEGTASRLAPDAPVPVLDDLVEHARPGGAALAASMAARDGHEVVLVTAIGDDAAGALLVRLLGDVDVRRVESDGPTPVKKRVRVAGQSLLRLDSGSRAGRLRVDPDACAEVLGRAAAVLVADYGRGIAGSPGLRSALTGLGARTPVVWDPHPRGATPPPGIRLAVPNEAEAQILAERLEATSEQRSQLAGAADRASSLVAGWQAQAVAVTLGAQGALLSYGAGVPAVVPAPRVPCLDPCGAGDRFAVSAAAALGAGSVTVEAVQRGVHDAASYVGAGGPASLRQAPLVPRPRATAEQLARDISGRGGTVVATGGCFDLLHAGHVATLRAARDLGDCLVVCLNSDESVRRLKGPSRPLVPAPDRARVLEALECVDAVMVFDEDTPVAALRRLRPDVWVKGGDYAGSDVPEAGVVREWGGQSVALPFIDGHSTTRLVQAARGADEVVAHQEEVER